MGVPGGDGVEPQVVAIEPPFAGNPSFTVGVWGALGGAGATLAIDSSDPGLVPPTSANFALEQITLADSADSAGWGSVSLAIPGGADLVGASFVGRWHVEDAAAAGGFAVSAPFQFTVFVTRRGIGGTVFADDFESASADAWSSSTP